MLLAGALLAVPPVLAQSSPPLPLDAAPLERARLTASRFLAAAADEVRPERFEFRSWTDAGWAPDSLITRTYDGTLLERETYSRWEGGLFGDWVESGYTVYTYFEGGLLSSRTQYALTPTGPTGVERDLHSYDGTVASEVITQVGDGGTWVDESRTRFTATDGQIVGWEDAEWDGTAWVPTDRAALTEADGDVYETHEVWDGSDWVPSQRTIYPDRTIAELIADLEAFVRTLTEHEGLLFGLRLPASTSQEWDETESSWVDVERTQRETWYDVFSGHIIEQQFTSETWEDGAWVPTVRIRQEYTRVEGTFDAPVPAATRFQFFDGEGWGDFMVETYIIQNDIARIVQATVQMDVGEGLENVSQVLIDWKALSTSAEPGGGLAAFSLAPNAPNPFTGGTTISFTLTAPQAVRLTVFDGLGREVAVLMDGTQPAGDHRVHWEATGLPAGVYLYRLEAGGHAQTRRALLVR